MTNEFTAIIEQDGPWFVAYSPEIPGANGQGQTASNGAVEYSPFGTHWNPNGGYYYARLVYKF